MTTKQFFEMLQRHDWYYAYSDDFGVYKAGERNGQLLNSTAKENLLFMCMYEDFINFHFSGEAFGKPKTKKPVLEDYLEG